MLNRVKIDVKKHGVIFQIHISVIPIILSIIQSYGTINSVHGSVYVYVYFGLIYMTRDNGLNDDGLFNFNENRLKIHGANPAVFGPRLEG